MSVEIVMPRAGLTMVEGTISEWKVAEGAQVNKGDVLMEYENEKNVIECEALESGIIHLVAKEGDTIPVGGVIAVMAADQGEYASIVGGAPAAAPAAPAAAAPAAAPAAGGEGVTEIEMPRAGLTMVEGTISEWKVSEGAQVNKGDVVMEFENEKNVIEYEIVHGGFLHIVAQAGETVAVGKPIAFVTETKAQYDALVNGGAPAAPAAPQPVAPGTAGQLKLYDVEPKTAAMIMAIVANKMGKPLNELRFISIKEVK